MTNLEDDPLTDPCDRPGWYDRRDDDHDVDRLRDQEIGL